MPWVRRPCRTWMPDTWPSSFGQIRSDGSFEEAADRLQVELLYTWQRKQPAPFVSLDVNTVWTGPDKEDRPLALRGSAGLHRSFGKSGKMRLGVGLERDFVDESNEVGLELVPEYSRQLRKNISLSSNAKIFAGATEARKVSIQSYNTLLIRLVGSLHTTVDAHLFVHRDSDVGELAFKSEVQIGLGYTWDKKWF
jgi:hypothetical protein